ncbi:protein kinase domain-containing protein [Streptomyces dysideae]|uniref:non-specific serine/threonine protein kinase n=1 Tax=Streptomyces dysideae TaxID=909626 RepID=A0A101V2V7_9ACTN|nr:protein kinase [Streptomyces dysideae]KUO21462.1 serine/threonine protein kinase [Streptomyces dysideae]
MGEVFAGRYELVDPIGRGGVGAVWRAWDQRRRRYVAAKVLQQRDAHSLLRFVREQALRIDHPHVLAPASWAADDDKVLFTMDLVSGGSLVHLIGDYGPLPPAFVCTLLDQLLSGLAAVHAEGVVHRDIKPANLLLEATGTGRPRLRLGDFGIAMRLGEPRLTETNLVVGTPGYLAPEQMMGAEPDFPADLFAVGLVALYLLEGAKPDAKALVQYFAEHGTPGAPKGIPEPLWQVVASLLQPDPQARFRTATGARKALASAAELLPEPGPDDELIEIFDQLGPLPTGFGPDGPLNRSSGSGRTGTVPTDPRASASEPGSFSSSSSSPSGSVPSEPSAPTQPPSMSDTGSFHLPPPQSTGSSAQTPLPPPPQRPAARPPQAQAQAQAQAHHDVTPHPYYGPTHVLSSPQPHTPPYPAQAPTPAPHQRVDASTASYTAQSPQVPPPAHPIPQRQPQPHAQPQSQPQPRPSHRASRRAARRPGPPAKVAIPMLLLALACYAVGFWALSHL